jgi:hypothetical protein
MASSRLTPVAGLASLPRASDVLYWEALAPRGKALRQARRLYKRLLMPEERIPWRWIRKGLGCEPTQQPDGRNCHLLLAGRGAPDTRRVVGMAYGAYLPSYGGYGAYLAVDERQRGRGIGTRLWQLLVKRFQLDAACAGLPLPFVVWESRPPAQNAVAAERSMWRSRLRIWARLGAWRIAGVKVLTPNFGDPAGPPVVEQLFLLPVDTPAVAFDSNALRRVVSGLLRCVYHQAPGTSLYDSTLRLGSRPVLEPLNVA